MLPGPAWRTRARTDIACSEAAAHHTLRRWALNPRFLYPKNSGPKIWRIVARRAGKLGECGGVGADIIGGGAFSDDRTGGDGAESRDCVTAGEELCPSQIWAVERPEDCEAETENGWGMQWAQVSADTAADWVQYDRLLVPRKSAGSLACVLETITLFRQPLKIEFMPRVGPSAERAHAELATEVALFGKDAGAKYARWCAKQTWTRPREAAIMPAYYVRVRAFAIAVTPAALQPVTNAALSTCSASFLSLDFSSSQSAIHRLSSATALDNFLDKFACSCLLKLETWCVARTELIQRREPTAPCNAKGVSEVIPNSLAVHQVSEELKWLSRDAFSNVYSALKKKYAKYLIDRWDERSDAEKSVFEDLAIAATLMVMWRTRSALDESASSSRTSRWPPKFVDCGCGNGLLVYILASEGFSGSGIDIQRRKLWARLLSPDEDDPSLCQPPVWHTILGLERQAVVLEHAGLDLFCSNYSACDWIIGNHSDELTPWIPVIAARANAVASFPKTQFFLLPCCFYELSGRRFGGNDVKLGKYRTYIKFLKELAEEFGFGVFGETLRIPSTKSQALVGLPQLNCDSDRGFVLSEARVSRLLTDRGIAGCENVIIRITPQDKASLRKSSLSNSKNDTDGETR